MSYTLQQPYSASVHPQFTKDVSYLCHFASMSSTNLLPRWLSSYILQYNLSELWKAHLYWYILHWENISRDFSRDLYHRIQHSAIHSSYHLIASACLSVGTSLKLHANQKSQVRGKACIKICSETNSDILYAAKPTWCWEKSATKKSSSLQERRE